MSRVPQPARATADSVVSNLVRRRSGKIEVWYVMGEQNTSGLAPHEEQAVAERLAYALSNVRGYRGRMHLSAKPFQVEHWGRELERRAVDPLPDTPGTPSFADWVEQMGMALAESHAAEPLAMCAFVAKTSVSKKAWRRIVAHFTKKPWDSTIPHDELNEEVTELDRVMALPGVDARRASTAEVDWLTHRGHALGVPAPALPFLGESVISTEQMRRYTDPAQVTYDPREDTLKVRVLRAGEQVEKRAAILAVSTLAGRRYQPLDQTMTHWMSVHRQEGMPEVEWMVDFEVIDPRPREANLLNVVTRLSNISAVFRANKTNPPLDLKIAEQQVMRAHQDATSSDQTTATWVKARMYIAVPGESDKDVRAKVKKLTTAASQKKGVELTWAPRSQYAFSDAFLPGVRPPAHAGLAPEMPARLFATGMPNAAESLGDQQGALVGHMKYDRNRPVLVDLHYAHEIDVSGTVAIIGDQGAGKTFTVNTLLYNQARMGDHCAYFAPDGQGARLGKLPEIAPYFQHIDLTGKDAQPGILAPTQLIPPVQRSAYPNDTAYREALFRSQRARNTLVYERLFECLPYQMRGPAAEAALTHAIGRVGTEYGTNPWHYIDELRRGDDQAKKIAQILAGLAEQSDEGALLFPASASDEVGVAENYRDSGRRVTVVSMQELKAPRKDAKPAGWSRSQRMFFPIMASAAFLTARMVYADFTTPTTTAFDEGKKLARTDSGMFLMTDLAENASRKHKASVIFTMLDPQPLVDGEISNLVKMWMLGHMEDVKLAEKAARLMGRQDDARRVAEQTTRFGKGQWFMRDVPSRPDQPGRFGEMQWTLDHNPQLRAVLRSEQLAYRQAPDTILGGHADTDSVDLPAMGGERDAA